MDTLFSFTLRGTKEANEDVFGRDGSYAWMIDGATDLWPERHFAQSDSQFLARLVSFELSALIEEGSSSVDRGPVDLMLHAIMQAEAKASCMNPSIEDVPAYALPSLAFMLVQDRGDGTIEAAALCDCHLFLDTGEHFTDTRFAPFEERNRRVIAALDDDTPEARLAIYQDTRKLLNQERGYWVGTLDGAGIGHAARMHFAAPAGTRIALATDGFVAALEAECADGQDMFDAIPATAAHLAGQFGQDRLQAHRDDASILVLEI